MCEQVPSETEVARELSQSFSTVLVLLHESDMYWSKEFAKNFIVMTEEAFTSVRKLFLVDQDDLLTDRQDWKYLQARRSKWYVALVATYPNGLDALKVLALKMEGIYGDIQLGQQPAVEYLTFLVSAFGILERPTRMAEQTEVVLIAELEDLYNSEVVVEGIRSEADILDSANEAQELMEARILDLHDYVFLINYKSGEFKRCYYPIDPKAQPPNILMLEGDDEPYNIPLINELQDLLQAQECIDDVEFGGEYLEIEIAPGCDWPEVDEMVEKVFLTLGFIEHVFCISPEVLRNVLED
jgi:hypothetical protein